MPHFTEFRLGWPALLGGTIGNFAGIGGLLYFALSSFMLPLEHQFGWTRTQIGFAVSCFTLGSIIASPMIGRGCDILGPRRIILASIPMAAALLASMAWLRGSIWELYWAYFLATLLGAGTLGITYINLVSGWFDERRGLAIGILLAGGGLSAFVLPLMLNWIIAGYGWRAGWLAPASIMLLQFPVAYFCLNEAPRKRAMRAERQKSKMGLFRDVLRNASFWKMSLPFLLVASTLSGLNVNLVAMLVDRRIESSTAARIAALLGIGIIVARLLVGYLLDRYPARVVACLVFIVAALGCAALLAPEVLLNAIGAFILGFTAGAEFDLLGFMSSRYFRPAFQGTVFGASLSVFNLGGMISPAVVGLLYGIHHDYQSALRLGIALCVLGAAIVASLGQYPVEPKLIIGDLAT